MSFLIELRCDHLKEDVDPHFSLPRCYSKNGRNIASRARNPSHAAALIVQLQARALRQGWVKQGRQWACPGCKNGEKK